MSAAGGHLWLPIHAGQHLEDRHCYSPLRPVPLDAAGEAGERLRRSCGSRQSWHRLEPALSVSLLAAA